MWPGMFSKQTSLTRENVHLSVGHKLELFRQLESVGASAASVGERRGAKYNPMISARP